MYQNISCVSVALSYSSCCTVTNNGRRNKINSPSAAGKIDRSKAKNSYTHPVSDDHHIVKPSLVKYMPEQSVHYVQYVPFKIH